MAIDGSSPLKRSMLLIFIIHLIAATHLMLESSSFRAAAAFTRCSWTRYSWIEDSGASLISATSGCRARGGWLATFPDLASFQEMMENHGQSPIKMAAGDGAWLFGGSRINPGGEDSFKWITGPYRERHFLNWDWHKATTVPVDPFPSTVSWMVNEPSSDGSENLLAFQYEGATVSSTNIADYKLLDIRNSWSGTKGYICEYADYSCLTYKYERVNAEGVTKIEAQAQCVDRGGWLATWEGTAGYDEMVAQLAAQTSSPAVKKCYILGADRPGSANTDGIFNYGPLEGQDVVIAYTRWWPGQREYFGGSICFWDGTHLAVNDRTSMKGTPFWLAPEVLLQGTSEALGTVGAPSDIWSLGCTRDDVRSLSLQMGGQRIPGDANRECRREEVPDIVLG